MSVYVGDCRLVQGGWAELVGRPIDTAALMLYYISLGPRRATQLLRLLVARKTRKLTILYSPDHRGLSHLMPVVSLGSLSYLKLGNLTLGSDVLVPLAAALATTKTLRVLHIDDCTVHPKDTHIPTGISLNNTLVTLKLCYDKTPTHARDLLKAIAGKSTLLALNIGLPDWDHFFLREMLDGLPPNLTKLTLYGQTLDVANTIPLVIRQHTQLIKDYVRSHPTITSLTYGRLPGAEDVRLWRQLCVLLAANKRLQESRVRTALESVQLARTMMAV